MAVRSGEDILKMLLPRFSLAPDVPSPDVPTARGKTSERRAAEPRRLLFQQPFEVPAQTPERIERKTPLEPERLPKELPSDMILRALIPQTQPSSTFELKPPPVLPMPFKPSEEMSPAQAEEAARRRMEIALGQIGRGRTTPEEVTGEVKRQRVLESEAQQRAVEEELRSAMAEAVEEKHRGEIEMLRTALLKAGEQQQREEMMIEAEREKLNRASATVQSIANTIPQKAQDAYDKYIEELESRRKELLGREPKFGENFPIFIMISLLGGTPMAMRWWESKRNHWAQTIRDLDRMIEMGKRHQDSIAMQEIRFQLEKLREEMRGKREEVKLVSHAEIEREKIAQKREEAEQKLRQAHELRTRSLDLTEQRDHAKDEARKAELALKEQRLALDAASRQALENYRNEMLRTHKEAEAFRISLAQARLDDARKRELENQLLRLNNDIISATKGILSIDLQPMVDKTTPSVVQQRAQLTDIIVRAKAQQDAIRRALQDAK